MASRRNRNRLARRFRETMRSQQGYVLILAMLILMAMGMAAATLVGELSINQQHVARDRAYTESLAVAEAGLNQYLWMLASGASNQTNGFAIPGNTGADPNFEVQDLKDVHTGEVQGTYAIRVWPPTATNANVTVRVTGQSNSPTDVPRTVQAQLGRPSYSQYVMLTNDEVWIGGPLNRPWHGKTHSNTGICIDTANVNDTISCANATYTSTMFGGTRQGVWSGNLTTVPAGDPSRAYWQYPVPAVDFQTVTSDFVALSNLAVGNGVNLPYSTTTAHGSTQGWYIKLLPGGKYQIMRVTGETETTNGSGGSLSLTAPSSPVPSGVLSYPNSGVIFVNDNVWVEGSGLSGRVTIASSGQLNASGKNAATSIHIVGDLTYPHDGTVKVGLIAQQNIEIPRYAPLDGATYPNGMEIDAAMIAQNGQESCNAADASGNQYGPIRSGTLYIYGAVASYHRPYRAVVDNWGTTLGGFVSGNNEYDQFLLKDPPPHTPVVGSFQILNWEELPYTQGILPGS